MYLPLLTSVLLVIQFYLSLHFPLYLCILVVHIASQLEFSLCFWTAILAAIELNCYLDPLHFTLYFYHIVYHITLFLSIVYLPLERNWGSFIIPLQSSISLFCSLQWYINWEMGFRFLSTSILSHGFQHKWSIVVSFTITDLNKKNGSLNYLHNIK